MRKHILTLLAASAALSVTAQAPLGNIRMLSDNGPAMRPAPEVRGDLNVNGFMSGRPNRNEDMLRRGIVPYSFIKVGTSYYDLQTNASISNRIKLYDDGSVSLVWTTSPDEGSTSFPNRGSGYNHRSGSSGNWGAVRNTRIESTRLGWPSVGVLANGNEWVLAHDATLGGFVLSKNSGKGQNDWSSTPVLKENNLRPIWARAASSGNYIHAIYSYTDSSQPGEPRAPTRLGVLAPMVYSRSTDGGATWDKVAQMLPGFDSSRITGAGADGYALDVRDSIVAIIFGGLADDVAVWKSTDNGNTFTKTIVDSFKYAPYASTKLMLDTPFSNDGSVSVLIDNDGKLHAFWGLSRMFDDDNSDQSFSFFPGFQNIVHWSEETNTSQIISSGTPFGRDETAGNSLLAATTAALSSGNVPSNLNTVARLGNTSAMRQPSPAIDANGNIYVSFSVPIEGDVSDLDANYRDIGMVYSTDGGVTWQAAQNLTQTMRAEDDFACLSPKADNYVHMVWQQDIIPGTALQNNSSSANNHETVLNDMLYAAIPTDKIRNNEIGHQWGLGVHKANRPASVFVVSQNYPNPFNGTSDVLIYLDEPATLQVEIRGLDGKVVRSQSPRYVTPGNHFITLNAAGLTPGVYFYTVTAGANTVTRKMNVQ